MYREFTPTGKVIITDSFGKARVFKDAVSADKFENHILRDFTEQEKKLPELTPKEQIRTMFNEILGLNPIPNLWPKNLVE